MKERCAVIDFETRSVLNIKKSNSWNYAKHPSTEALCLAYKLPGKKTRLWHMAHPAVGIEESELPEDLFKWIKKGGLVEAHNAFFERCIWYHVMVAKHGWPEIKHEQWRCTAARAAAMSLPRALENILPVLGLGEKDMVGHKLMLKLCKPRKPRKAEVEEWTELCRMEGRDDPHPVIWHEDPKDLKRVWLYCKRDVRGEYALSKYLDDLSPKELKVWQMDQEMNWYGVWCDRELVNAALELTEEALEMYKGEFEEMGVVTPAGEPIAPTKRQAVKKWLADVEGIDLPDTAAETLEEYGRWAESGKVELSDRAKRVLLILRNANRTSTAKYKSMLEHMDPDDDRIRNAIMYCGADRTGRFSGKGVQPHNFPRGTIKNVEGLCEDILERDINWLAMLHGDPMEALSSALRGALGAPPSYEIDVADFAAIEARVVFWVSEAKAALKVFREGGDIYLDMAEEIYGYKCTKENNPDERQMGKQAILGLGFGMGFPKFWKTLRDKYAISFTMEEARRIVPNLDDVMYWIMDKGKAQVTKSGDISIKKELHCLAVCKHIVDIYRNKYPEVVEFWNNLFEAACSTVKERRPHKVGRIEYFLEGDFLKCRLPSGRKLHYFKPKVEREKKPWGGTGDNLSYGGNDQKTKQWGRVGTYGGKLCENIVQAIARDLMVEGMINVHYGKNEYKLVLSVHDELIAQKPKGYDGKFADLMVAKPRWADGCPVDAEGWTGTRYKKG